MFSKYILYLSTLLLWTFNLVYPQQPPQAVINDMASREMRHHHLLWHTIRNAWNRLDSDVRADIRRLGWAPPRPSQGYDSDGDSFALEDNASGEDFLYMHRDMINRVNRIAASVGSSWRVRGWETIPRPGDDDWPVPAQYSSGSSTLTSQIREMQSNAYYTNNIRPRELRFTDPSYLRGVTLGQLGSRIEFTIHAMLHLRFSARSSVGYRSRPSNPVPDISTRWDNRDYDWLVDAYGSHVNPIFWKIHGWVDDRIEDWRRANGLSAINWRGTWTGGPMNNVDELVQVGDDHNLRVKANEIASPGQEDEKNESGEDGKSVNVMEELMQILNKAGVEFHIYDEVVCTESDVFD